MKCLKFIAFIFTVIMAVSCVSVLNLFAATPESSFEFNSSTGTITKFIGNETDVVIPDKINGVDVKTIGWSAFQNCTSLTSLIIPNSVTPLYRFNTKPILQKYAF